MKKLTQEKRLRAHEWIEKARKAHEAYLTAARKAFGEFARAA